MGYVLSPRIGDGPTDACRACEHTDCAATRALVAAPCAICGQPLGQGVKFYTGDDGRPEHAACAWKARG